MSGEERQMSEIIDQAMDAYAAGAVEEMLPVVRAVVAAWTPLALPSEFEELRRRILLLPAAEVYVPALTAEGIMSAFEVFVEEFGTADWSVRTTEDGCVIEPIGEVCSHDDIEEGRIDGLCSLAMGCAATLVRALAAATDDDGCLVGELDECMVPTVPASQAAFDRYLAENGGQSIETTFIRAVLRECKRTLPEGRELPQALAEGFPRRPVG